MDKKNYVIDLAFGTWHNQTWFSGDNSEEADEKWSKAVRTLDNIGDNCTSAGEFTEKAVEHFEEYGFEHIRK